MSSVYFIADLHLDADRPALSRALAEFLHRVRDCHALYILGDLFEAWVGDDDDAPLASNTRALLRAFTDAGPSLYLLRGNRDFLLGEEFCRATGATLLPDAAIIDLHGVRTLLMHGDSLCTADHDYQAFRRQTHDTEWREALLAKSLSERRLLARNLRNLSREAVQTKAETIMDVTPSAVGHVMAHYAVRRLIHGHTHRPGRYSEPGGTRWVLGEWGASAWALESSSKHDEVRLIDILQ